MLFSNIKTFLLFNIIFFLSACQIKPLYYDNHQISGAHSTIANKLATIDIKQPQGRAEQIIRNELLFSLGSDQNTSLYLLTLRTQKSISDVNVEIISGSPTSKSLNLTTAFTLKDINSQEIILKGSSFATSSFDWSLQRFANARAEIDAEKRTAKVIADDIRLRLASFMATYKD